jgi:hypothetical protein
LPSRQCVCQRENGSGSLMSALVQCLSRGDDGGVGE